MGMKDSKLVSVANQIEDQTYIDNALTMLRLSKAFDLLGEFEKAYLKATKASETMEQLIKIRKEQRDKDPNLPEIDYSTLMAPFYYRVGDVLATYIEVNTNELG